MIFDIPRSLSFFGSLDIFQINPLTEPNKPLLLFIVQSSSSYVGSAALSFYIVSRPWLKALLAQWMPSNFGQRIFSSDIQEHALEGVESLIVDIERRVSRLQVRSNLVLMVIIFTLLTGVVLIIFAGRLTSIDAESASNISIIKDEINTLDRSISDITARISRLLRPPKSSATDVPALADDTDVKALVSDRKRVE
jgi:hypothetical protein